MMNEVQAALFSKPGEALKWGVDQVVVFMQVYVPAKCGEYAHKVC